MSSPGSLTDAPGGRVAPMPEGAGPNPGPAVSCPRIAVIIPVVYDVLGNRAALLLASRLARLAEVDVIISVTRTDLLSELEGKAFPARVHVGSARGSGSRSMLKFLASQLAWWVDWRLAKQLRLAERLRPFDSVLVVANEGHGIARLLRRHHRGGGSRSPVMGVCLMELPDYIFTKGDDRPGAGARRLLRPVLLPLLHAIERRKLASFDRYFANSQWTQEQLQNLYGIRSDTSLAAADLAWFVPGQKPARGVPADYVALPTASWKPEWDLWAKHLHDRGVPVVAFGSRRVPYLPNLGFLDDEELRRVLGGARATLFLFDYEALGLIPLESLACGTPVITLSKEGPYSELRGNPYVSFVATPGEAAARAEEALARALSPEERWQVRASVARFDPETVAVRLFDLLRGPPVVR